MFFLVGADYKLVAFSSISYKTKTKSTREEMECYKRLHSIPYHSVSHAKRYKVRDGKFEDFQLLV